jgi:hypothetical protein
MSALWSLSGDKRTLRGHRQSVENDPERKLALACRFMCKDGFPI